MQQGSCAWLYDENIHSPRCFQHRDPQRVYCHYLQEMTRMVGAVRANVLAHFDRIFWRGYTLGHRFEELVCGTAAREALCAAVENGYALELNSRLLGVSPQWHDLLLLLLSWYKAAGGDHVLVNSDAHSTRQIGLNYHLANDLLHQAGLRARSSVPQREAI